MPNPSGPTSDGAPTYAQAVDADQIRALVAALHQYPGDAAVRLAVADGDLRAMVDHGDLSRPQWLRVDHDSMVTRIIGPSVDGAR